MKCPKCGYTSFDNNQVCPKCNRDISYEQEKLNLPAFRPNPPSLLGALTGEVIESHVDMQIDQSYTDDVSTDIVTEEDVNYEDSGVIDMGEVTFNDSAALDSGEIMFNDSQEFDVDLELGETTEFDAPESLEALPEEESVSDLDLESLTESTETMTDKDEPESDEEDVISLDLEDLPDEEPGIEGIEPLESTQEEEGEVSFDFEDMSLDESDSTDASQIEEPEEEIKEDGIEFDGIALEDADLTEEPQIEEPEEETEGPGIDFDSIALEKDREAGDEIELGLEDLKIDESGEIEIRTESGPTDEAPEDLLDLENIDMELDLDEDKK